MKFLHTVQTNKTSVRKNASEHPNSNSPVNIWGTSHKNLMLNKNTETVIEFIGYTVKKIYLFSDYIFRL